MVWLKQLFNDADDDAAVEHLGADVGDIDGDGGLVEDAEEGWHG